MGAVGVVYLLCYKGVALTSATHERIPQSIIRERVFQTGLFAYTTDSERRPDSYRQVPGSMESDGGSQTGLFDCCIVFLWIRTFAELLRVISIARHHIPAAQ